MTTTRWQRNLRYWGMPFIVLATITIHSCGKPPLPPLTDSPPPVTADNPWPYEAISPDDFTHPDKLQPSILSLINQIVYYWDLPGSEFIVHSDFRHKSRHPLGMAVDFRMSSYRNMSRGERLCRFWTDMGELDRILFLVDIFDEIGWGIYPRSTNPFFHIDRGNRNSFGSWAGLGSSGGGPYVSFRDGINDIENQLAELGHTCSWFFR